MTRKSSCSANRLDASVASEALIEDGTGGRRSISLRMKASRRELMSEPGASLLSGLEREVPSLASSWDRRDSRSDGAVVVLIWQEVIRKRGERRRGGEKKIERITFVDLLIIRCYSIQSLNTKRYFQLPLVLFPPLFPTMGFSDHFHR